jgi:CRISPR-associated protein Csb1
MRMQWQRSAGSGESREKAMAWDFEALRQALREAAGIRRNQRLVPGGGAGDKVFPPTYPGEGGPVHLFEERRIGDAVSRCVLLDSVQSQANRMELALLSHMRAQSGHETAQRVHIPHILTDFTGARNGDIDLSDIGAITSLEAPHRVFDAIFRDSQLHGKSFWQSAEGRRLVAAKPDNATAIFELSPTALVFGCWHSTGQGGGLGAKFPRAIVSEIVGVDAVPGRRTGSRIDPLQIRREVEIWKGEAGWDVSKEVAGAKAKKVRPSEINHGNIAPSIEDLGVTIGHALHTVVISLPTLRRLRFPDDQGHIDPARDEAARCVLAALALLAVTAQDAEGYSLRSRCDLVRDGRRPFELLSADGESSEFDLDLADAVALYREAVEAAKTAGLPWRDEPLRLTPETKLVRIVAESRRRALAGEAAAEGGE